MQPIILKNGTEIKPVADNNRLTFLPAFFKRDFIRAENALYTIADRMLAGYNGGFWTFATITKGHEKYPMFLLETNKKALVENPFSGDRWEMDETLAGIIMTIYACNLLDTENGYTIAAALTSVAYDYAEETGQIKEAFKLLD